MAEETTRSRATLGGTPSWRQVVWPAEMTKNARTALRNSQWIPCSGKNQL